jgi:hypothetical protein
LKFHDLCTASPLNRPPSPYSRASVRCADVEVQILSSALAFTSARPHAPDCSSRLVMRSDKTDITLYACSPTQPANRNGNIILISTLSLSWTICAIRNPSPTTIEIIATNLSIRICDFMLSLTITFPFVAKYRACHDSTVAKVSSLAWPDPKKDWARGCQKCYFCGQMEAS